jgi:hypothetical protein
MLAFSKDITQKNPKVPQEGKDAKLKDYMDYQRKLNNSQIVYHSLKYAKTLLETTLKACRKSKQDPIEFVSKAFPFSHRFADPKTLLLMIKKLINGHNVPRKWYRMNAYYYTLAYDCLKLFTTLYNGLVQESPEEAKDYSVAQGQEIDFNDWVYLFFEDLDFHLGQDLGYNHYPFAKRNKAIEEALEKEMQNGRSREEGLKAIQESFEIDDCSIKVLMNKKISEADLELFYTTMDNHIYEFLTFKKEGSWESMDGECLMDQVYTMGSQMKVTVWKKRKKKES